MEALISGRAGLALVLENGLLASIHAEAPDETIPRRPAEFHQLSGGARDFLVLEDTSREEVVRQLLLAQDREDALRLVLIAQDPDMAEDIRAEAIQDLEGLLAEQHERELSRLRRQLEYVLYAQPSPPSLDLPGAIRLALRGKALEVADLLERYADHQEAITQVRQAWESIAPKAFGEAKDAWQATAVREGLFHEFASRQATPTGLRRVPPYLASRPALEVLPNAEEVLSQWLAAIRRLSMAQAPGAGAGALAAEELRLEDLKRRCEALLAANLAELGEAHPKVARDRSELALVLRDLGDWEAAATQLRAALAMDVARLGETLEVAAPTVSKSEFGERSWGSLLSTVGEASLETEENYEAVLERLRGALEEFDRTLGPEHPLTTINRALLATVLLKQGSF